MDFRILGRTQVVTDGGEVALGGSQRRALLAVLLVDPGVVVPAERLVEALWPSGPPTSAAQTVQSHVSHLRKLLGADRIETVSGGYRLVVNDVEVDAVVFEREFELARVTAGSGDAAGAVTILDSALGRWRGAAFEDADGCERAVAESAWLEGLRTSALELLLDARLALGQHDRVAVDAEAAVGQWPLHERLWASLMTALYRCGRHADALRGYQRLRSILAEELGLEPSPSLVELEARILRHDVSLLLPLPAATPPAGAQPSGGGMPLGDHEADGKSATPTTPAPTSVGPPTGTVTFVFTDIEGSTDLWEAAPGAMRDALDRHDDLLRAAVLEHDGHVFSTSGGGLAAAFTRAVDAARAAQDAQTKLGGEPWAPDAQIKVRMALQTGEADERGGDYFGPALNRAARLMALGHGGQILCSRLTADLLKDSVPLVDLGKHRLRDLLAPERVLQVGDEAFPPLRSIDSVPSNLPTMPTELVGRTEDIAQLAELVKTERLVTLTGVGGVGKTRLALAVAATRAGDFPDGCWIVELAPVADGADVERAVCAALGAPAIETSTSTGLRNYLENRRLVLLLDNCEHVLDDCARLADLVLNAAGEVHIITTSREPLGVDGEVVRRVRSLEVPDDAADLNATRSTPAIQLFSDRASSASETFALTRANAGDVVEICRKLDGIPLAIELAAARVGSMSVNEIAQRLDERFRLLAGGRRAQERHRTLQAAVSWSYDLLSPVEQEVFRQLAVFPASFALAAVEAIVAGGDVDGIDAVEATVHLAERSLVQYDPATGRYRLLETLRQFAADRLAESGASDAIRDRYAAYYADLVAELAPTNFDERFETTNAVLAAELDNIRATAEWLVRCERWRPLYELCHAGAVSFLTNYTTSEGFQWYQMAMGADAVSDPQERVDALGEMAACATQVGLFELADPMACESVELAAHEGVEHCPWAWFSRSMGALYMPIEGDRQGRSLEYAHRMRDAVVARGDPPGLRMHAEAMTMAPLTELGRFDEADAIGRRLLDEAAALGNSMVLSVVVTTVTSSLLRRPEPDRAAALAVFEAHDPLLTSPGVLMDTWISVMRSLALTAKDPSLAVTAGVRAARGADRAGSSAAMAEALDALSYAVALTGRLDTARRIADGVDDVYLPLSRGREWYRAQRDQLLGAVENGPTPKPTRQELLAILAGLDVA